MKHRKHIGIVAVSVCLALSIAGCGESPIEPESTEQRPNILWIVADDISFELGAYGDPLSRTPNIDRLASEGVRFTNAFSTSGVCGPSRAALITGMYATSFGAHHMRSLDRRYQPVPPPEVKTFTEHLRAAGYYASSVGKLDYQFSGVLDGAPRTNWDDANGSFRGRAPDQRFFSYVTFLDTHESQLFGTRPLTTDPAMVTVPPYYPDTPVVRADLARHYDNIATLDAKVGEVLAMLDADGLADDTAVFFFADNGRGFPRDKRWVYDGGTHLPLIVRWPGHLAPGTTSDELVSYVDLAPTALALAGVPVPDHMHGRVFVGEQREPPPPYIFAAEDRHDEATDRIRLVRDKRWAYLRNYYPETPYGQTVRFRNNLATMQEIFRLHDAGLLQPPADWYYQQTKPPEELYDTVADPYQLDNLAERPEQQERLARMRAAHERWVTETGDLGAIPESELADRYWPGGEQPMTPSPTLSSPSGQFDSPVTIAMDAIDGASIAYTLDPGDAPRWQLYTQPIALTASATVRARAVRYGWAESAEVAESFEIVPR